MKKNERALSFAKKNNKLQTIGTDAHFTFEVGRSYLEVKDFDITDKKQFLNAIQSPKKYVKNKAPIFVRGTTTIAIWFKPFIHE